MSTRIPAPRVGMVDPTTGMASRPWFLFLDAIYNATGIGESFLSHVSNIVEGSYSPLANDWHLYCTAPAGIALQPSAARDRELVITNASAGVVTLIPDGTETINGASSVTIDFQWTTLQLRPIIGGYIIQ